MTTIDDLRQTFFEESSEGLDAIDSGLAELNDSSTSDETVNAVFRAIHSIKGGAGVFGFSGLVDFAHVFETVLDQLRHGKLAVSPQVVEVLQKANDTLSDLVAMSRAGETPPPDFDSDSRSALKQLTGGDGHDAEEGVAPDFDGIDFQPVMAADTASEPQRFKLIYRTTQAEFDDSFAAVVRALRAVGQVHLAVNSDGVPTLDECDAQKSYIECSGEVESEFGLDELRKTVAENDPGGRWSLMDAAAGADAQTPAVADTAEAPPMIESPPLAAAAEPAAVAKRVVPAPAEAREASHTKPSATTIRVDLEKIDRVVNMVGELVISQTMLGQLFQNMHSGGDTRLSQGLDDVFLHTRELKNSVMAMRAQPVRSVFQRMSRLVRELAVKTGKRARLETFGEGTEVDKTVIERLSDPLTHIIRNAMDHGIETPERRRELGKPEEGTITLLADQRSSRIVIEIGDDGAGIDPERVIKKARDKGLIPLEGQLSEDEINNLIFLPGFSTASGVSEISGRGVGMDVVRRNVQELGGRISLKSTPGKGMTIQLALPLTLAVMDGMIVRAASETYVMPISSIVECIRPSASDFHALLGTRGTLRLRGAIVPIVHLGELLELASASEFTDESTVIIVETNEGVRLGIVVDQLVGHQQVVIKSIEENYAAVPGIAGATILGDGHVAFILDAERLGDFARNPQFASAHQSKWVQ